MHGIWSDIRLSLRLLRRSAGFSAATVLSLAVAIAANTGIFTVANAMLFRPLPYPEADRIVMLRSVSPSRGLFNERVAGANFLDWQRTAHSFDAMAAYRWRTVDLTGSSQSERLRGLMIAGKFFDVLGVRQRLGHTFTTEEELSHAREIILGHRLWQRRFAANPGVVGQTLDVNIINLARIGPTPHEIAGVIPTDVHFPPLTEDFQLSPSTIGETIDFWTPMTISLTNREFRDMDVIARLREGVTVPQAQAEMHAIARWLAEAHPDMNKDWDISVVPLRDHILGNSRHVLALLSAGAAVVLLIACANIASLMLARSTARHKETIVRVALGAGQLRILRQFLTEAGLMCGIGAVFGILLAFWVINFFRPLLSLNTLAGMELAVDARVLIYTAVATIISAIVTGIVPAFRLSRTNLGEMINSQARTVTIGRSGRRTVAMLVISEVSMTLMLLIGTGLLVKSLSKLWNVNPGFDPDHLLTMTISLPNNKFDWQHNSVFGRQVIDAVEQLPFVDKAAVVQGIPMRSGSFFGTFQVEGRPLPPPGERPISRIRVVSPTYFRVMKIPILAGREFEPRDEIGQRGKPPYVIVSKTFAGRFWPGESALGKRLRDPSVEFWSTVVGIAGDVKYSSLDGRAEPELYFPEALFPQSAITLIVRTRINPLDLGSRIQQCIREIDREAFITDIKSMEQLMSDTLTARRFSTLLITAFGLVALILAVTGIYGVIAYSIAQRKIEIGIRVALGAHPRDVTLLAIKVGLMPAVLGMLLGSLLTLASGRLLSAILFEVAPFDLGVWAATSLTLITVATAAAYIPARQAGVIDPMIAMRAE